MIALTPEQRKRIREQLDEIYNAFREPRSPLHREAAEVEAAYEMQALALAILGEGNEEMLESAAEGVA